MPRHSDHRPRPFEDTPAVEAVILLAKVVLYTAAIYAAYVLIEWGLGNAS